MNFRPAPLLLALLTTVFGMTARADDPPAGATNPPTPVYETRSRHDPNGIGKFYQGREIAMVMGHQAADWLERPERAEEEKPDLLMQALNIQPGERVADIGAGTGYYTRRLAEKVGSQGAVYAVEIQQEMLDILTNKMVALNFYNVKPVLGTVSDPRLPANTLDLILMVDVYHGGGHGGRVETRRSARVCGISRGRPQGADQRGAQDDRGAGEKGNGRISGALGPDHCDAPLAARDCVSQVSLPYFGTEVCRVIQTLSGFFGVEMPKVKLPV